MIGITNPAAFRRLVDVAARADDCHLPLATWAQAGKGAVVFVTDPAASWPKRIVRRYQDRPTVIVIGADQGQDDDPLPTAWACRAGLVRWAERASILLHAAGGEAEHYRLACREAERRGKVLIVECTPRTLPAWADALPKRAVLTIVPRDGRHPIQPATAH